MILGAQFYTLRDFCKTLEGLDESMKKVADMGFTAIQLSGVCAYEPEWVAEKAKAYGLKIAITHFDYNRILNDTEATIEFHKKMDCKYIGLGAAPSLLTRYGEFIGQIPEAMDKIAAAGLKFCYHNHDLEFA
jgi:sugar phosphate isomerase/epimerase